MCGIIGYIGKNKATQVLQQGLKTLEYRGYDSAGICIYNKKFITTKKAGTVDNLFKYVDKTLNSNIGIGHTRWATHGEATDVNSHPHSSFYNRVTVVHNGIIENYKDLQQTHLQGIKLKGKTDTEVVSNLIEKNYIMLGNKIKAIAETLKLLKGSYALAILFSDDSKSIYFAKNFSPLLIGIGNEENFISSDILGFINYTKKYVEIEDNTFGKLSANSLEIFDIDQKSIEYTEKYLPLDYKQTDKQGYPFYMIKEINEIPKIIEDTVDFYEKNKVLQNIDKNNNFKNVNRIKLIACGTSYHACLIGEQLLNNIGYDTSSYIASEFIYSDPLLNKNTLCVFVSQSGETADTLSAVKIAKTKGAKTLCITNVETSTITKICDYILPIKCGSEIAVASTKAYNGQLTAFYILSSYLYKTSKNYKKMLNSLKELVKQTKVKEIEKQTKPLIKAVLEAKTVFMVGRQADYVTSLESSLKLKEITYINCQGYASGELKHGTISLVDENTLVFAFITNYQLASKTINVIKQTQSRGAKICVITPFDEILQDETINYKIKLPQIDETLYPLVAVLPMQLISYYTSVTLGYNPDKPRNLAKSVTVE